MLEMNMKITIIGLGHIGSAIGRGLSQRDRRYEVYGCDRNQEKCVSFTQITGFPANEDSQECISSADIILLCVRTNQVNTWLTEARSLLRPSQALVCLSVGVCLNELQTLVVPSTVAIYRAITNVNVSVRFGQTVLLRSEMTQSSPLSDPIEKLFQELGEVVRADSDIELDRLSVLPGCVPAATALFLQGLIAFGVRSGFTEQHATHVAEQGVRASIEAMQKLDIQPQIYKRSVAAPGGIVDRLFDSSESSKIVDGTSAWFSHILTHIEGEIPTATNASDEVRP